jgi:glyoxylase-like metal-dependent hydrolase (beta-lactamase superfamily II)
MITELAPGLYTAEQRVAEGKNGIVVGSRAALAIDTGNDAGEGGEMAGFIRALGHEPRLLALTHGHGDHILGSGAFPDAEVIAHALTPGVMREELARIAPRLGRSAEEIAGAIRWPTLLFDGELTLDLGGKTIRWFHLPGHSPDGVALYVEEDRALFAGDTVVTGIVPAIGQGDSRQMETSLRRLAELDIDILVPGHGEPLLGAGRVRDWLAWQGGYLARVRAFARAGLAQGHPPEEIAEGADFAEFIGDRLPADRHTMPKRHRDTVMKIAREVARAEEMTDSSLRSE